MFPTSNYEWSCKDCGEKSHTHQDNELSQPNVVSPKCPKCYGEMAGKPIVHRGPFPENPFKKN
jgi:NAD-dependent SIR2 family protein deacetylase